MLVRTTRGRQWIRRSALRGRLRALRADESGIAILTVVTTIAIALAVGGVAAVTATNAMQGSIRDESSKDALAAADAGAQLAILRQNQVAVDPDDPLASCIVEGVGGLVAGPAGPDGWCGEFEGTVGDASYSYRVRSPQVTALLSEVEVVATGTSNGVTRRMQLTAQSPNANAIFANSTVISDSTMTLNGNAQIHGNAATNGDIVLNNNADLCGVAQHGEAGSIQVNNNASHGGPECEESTYPAGPGTVSLPPVDQGDVADPANNDNDRIDPSNPLAPDTISGNGQVTFFDRILTLDSNSSITLGGSDYSFCGLRLKSNTELIVAASAEVRIFFDAPENCPTLGAGPQIELDSNSRLTTTDGQPASLQLLVVGSDDPAVTSDDVVLDSNSKSTMPVILYAPRSGIELNSNSSLLGALAGQSVNLDGNSKVFAHTEGASSLELPLPLKYEQSRFVECTSTAAPSPPNSNC